MASKSYIHYYYIIVFYTLIFVASATLYEGDPCRTSDRKSGICKQLKQCESVYPLLVARKIQPGSYVRCSFVRKEEVICCVDQKPSTTPVPFERLVDPTYNGSFIFPGDVVIKGTTQPPLPLYSGTRGTFEGISTFAHKIIELINSVRTLLVKKSSAGWIFPMEPAFQQINLTLAQDTTDRSELNTNSVVPSTTKQTILATQMAGSIGQTTFNRLDFWPFVQIYNENNEISEDEVYITTSATNTSPDTQIRVSALEPWIFDELLNSPYSSPTEIEALMQALELTEKRRSELACDRYYEGYTVPLDYHILNGIPAAPGEFPHMVAVAHSTTIPDQVIFDCGASLISENFALTAAHCVNRPELWPTYLRLGKVSLRSMIDEAEPVDVEVSEVILHPEYRGSRAYHDIALLRLKTNLTFTDFVKPVCLYNNKTPIDRTVPLIATGWGRISFQNRSTSDVLLKVKLASVDRSQCNSSYMEGDVDRRIRDGVIEGQICAYDSEGDACQGDSGGPLQIVGEDKKSVLVGIISLGDSCGSSVPSIYTSIAHYLDWIESIVW